MVRRIVALSWLVSNVLICAFTVIGDKASTDDIEEALGNVSWLVRVFRVLTGSPRYHETGDK